MQILVLNPGSSSIKFSVFRMDGGAEPRSVAEGELSGIGGGEAELSFRDAAGGTTWPGGGERRARCMRLWVRWSARLMSARLAKADAVGYRVVHPGPRLKGHQRITPEVIGGAGGGGGVCAAA